MIGLNTKILIAFKDDKPMKNEDAKNLCFNIFNNYIKD